MRSYPSYTFEMVLSEYACRFFALLVASQKMDALENLERITASSIPHMKEEDSRRIIDLYKKQAGEDTEVVDTEMVKDHRRRLLQKLKSKML